MKLPDFLEWASFNQMRHGMGAELITSYGAPIKMDDFVPPDIGRLGGEGIEVSMDDITIHDDKTLSYKGQRVLLYIRDIATYGKRRDELPKFHLAYCRTLQQMRRAQRFEKYVANHREDGVFDVNFIDQGKKDTANLKVCQCCLDELKWKSFYNTMTREQRARAVEAFSLAEFFKVYPRDVHNIRPKHTSITAPVNKYTDNWPAISQRIKQIRNYQCETCGIQLLGDSSRFLDAHHRNGMKYDNDDANLEVLCIRCHSDEPMHIHMRNDQRMHEFNEFLNTRKSLDTHP